MIWILNGLYFQLTWCKISCQISDTYIAKYLVKSRHILNKIVVVVLKKKLIRFGDGFCKLILFINIMYSFFCDSINKCVNISHILHYIIYVSL